MVDPRVRFEVSAEPHPIGRVSILATIHTSTGGIVPGSERPARLGARVYLAPTEMVGLAVDAAEPEARKRIKLGTQPLAHDAALRVSPESLFDRHRGHWRDWRRKELDHRKAA